jgi:hypothetical protein
MRIVPRVVPARECEGQCEPVLDTQDMALPFHIPSHFHVARPPCLYTPIASDKRL